MSAPLHYKGYFGTVEYSAPDKVFYGKLDGIGALVSYEGTDVESLENDFREAIDDYLDLCATQGFEPEKPYKGAFNVRVPSELHRDLVMYAKQRDITLNAAARAAFELLLHGTNKPPTRKSKSA